METKLSAFCERVIEAGWLIAAVILPVYFNSYSFRIFEPDKFSLLRSIALLMALAWLVGRLERGAALTGNREIRLSLQFLRDPLWGLTWLLVVIYLLATVTSVVPTISLWGSYQRLQGLYSVLAAALIFLLTYGRLRTPAQRERLTTVILLASWPVSLFAVLQHFGLGPPFWQGDDPSRVFSTLGNPIFLGGYLIMIIPLAVARLGQSIVSLRSGRGSRLVHFTLLIVYGLLLLMNLAALLFTRSRGPWMGFMAGTFFLVLLLLAVRRQPALALLWLLAGAVVVGGLVALSLPDSPLASLAQGPYLGRLAGLLDPGSGTARVRVLIWQSAVTLLASNPQRLLVGFGPDSGLIVLTPAMPPELPRLEVPGRIPDRAHNLVLDHLITTGLPGLVTYLLFFSTVFYYGLRGMGLTRGSPWRFAAHLVAGVMLGALAPPLIGWGWPFAGPGIAAGWLLGLMAYLIGQIFAGPRDPVRNPGGDWLTTAALLAGLAAHLVEASFGLVVSATLFLFWIFAALLGRSGLAPAVKVATGEGEATEPDAIEDEPDWEEDEAREVHITRGSATDIALGWDQELAVYGWLGALVMATLGFSLIRVDIFQIPGSHLGAVLVLAGAWLFATVMLTASRQAMPGQEAQPGSGWVVPTLSLIGLSAYLILWTGLLVMGGDALQMLVGYYALVMLGALVVARALPALEPTQVGPGLRVAAYVPLLAAVLVVILVTNVRPIQADIYFQAAESFAAAGRWEDSLYLYERAMAMQPEQAVYPQFLAEKYVRQAQVTPDPEEREALFDQARLMAERAWALNPRQVDHTFNLAHLHLIWGQMTADPGRRGLILDRALFYYQQAAAIMPRSPDVYNEMGLAYQLKGDYEQALQQFRRAQELDPGLARTYLLAGRLYQETGNVDQAITMYEQAARLEPRRVEPYNALGQVYLQQGRFEDALQVNLKAVELAPDNFVNHYNLALIFQRLGRPGEAKAEALRAWELAPAGQKPAVESLIQSLNE